MEIIQFGGRPVVGFGLGESDPCEAWPFQGLFGYATELPVLRAEDEQTDAYMTSLNAALEGTCPKLRDVDKVGWQALYQKWQTVHNAIQALLKDPPTIGYQVTAAEYMCRISALRVQADNYQKMAATQCNPKTVPNAPPPPDPPEKKDGSGAQLASTLKTVAIAIAATTGIVYVIPLIGRLLPPERLERR